MTPLKAENSALSLAEKILQPLIIISSSITLGYGFLMLSQWITFEIWGTSIVNIQDFNAMDANELKAYRLSQIFNQIGTFLLAPIFFATLVKVKPIEFWGINKKVNTSNSIWVLWLLILSLFSSSFLYGALDFVEWPQIFKDAEATNQSLIEQLLLDQSFGIIILNILMFAVLPAVLEEIFFRGTVQKMLINITGKPHFAIIITSVIFGLVHGNIPGILAYTAMGLILGYLFFATGNLKYSILFHFLNNGLSLLFDWLYKSEFIEFDPLYATLPLIPGLVSTALLAYFMVRFYNLNLKPKLKISHDKNPSVVWVKIYENHDLIQVQMICDRLNSEGYDAAILNKRDSTYGYGYAEIHVPIHQVDSAKSFIETLNI